jgi:hypothetical protein
MQQSNNHLFPNQDMHLCHLKVQLQSLPSPMVILATTADMENITEAVPPWRLFEALEVSNSKIREQPQSFLFLSMKVPKTEVLEKSFLAPNIPEQTNETRDEANIT